MRKRSTTIHAMLANHIRRETTDPNEAQGLIAYLYTLEVKEAIDEISFMITEKDCNEGLAKSFTKCPIALAIKRAIDAKLAFIMKEVAYVDHVDTASGKRCLFRYGVYYEALEEVKAHDKGRGFRPRVIKLRPHRAKLQTAADYNKVAAEVKHINANGGNVRAERVWGKWKVVDNTIPMGRRSYVGIKRKPGRKNTRPDTWDMSVRSGHPAVIKKQKG